MSLVFGVNDDGVKIIRTDWSLGEDKIMESTVARELHSRAVLVDRLVLLMMLMMLMMMLERKLKLA